MKKHTIKYLSLILFTALLFSCNSDNDISEKGNGKDNLENYKEKNDFQEYLSLIPKLELPITFVCEDGFSSTDIDIENTTLIKYLPDGASIIGQMTNKKGEIIILYGFPADVFFPIAYTYNSNGLVLNKIEIFKLGECVDDIGYSVKTYGTISKELIINRKIITVSSTSLESGIEHADTTITYDSQKLE